MAGTRPYQRDDRHWSARPLHAAAPGGHEAQVHVGYELLSEPQRDITPEEAADRLRAVTL